MKAEDTVMNPNDATAMLDDSFGKIGENGIDYCGFDIEPLLEAQAEISFKTGQEDTCIGRCRYNLQEIGYYLQEVRKQGRKEVVDWLINDSYDTTIHFGEDWQAKLKEWGLTNG